MKKTAAIMAVIFILALTACSQGAATALPEQTAQTGQEETAQPAQEQLPSDGQGAAPSQNQNTASDQGQSSGEVKSAKKDIFAMDTYMTVTCCGDRCEEAAAACEAEITRLDNLLSVGNKDSEVSIINDKGEGALSEDSQIMVKKALDIFQKTGGAFDITVYPLMELWGFTTQDYKVPDDAGLKDTLAKVGSEKISVDGDKIELNEAEGIDLGGIAKGYTSDRLMGIFKEYDLVSGMVSLGGNVQLYGTKPDGSLWKCGIQDPHPDKSGEQLLGILQASDCAVITSGAYERYFTDDDGTHYHHIIDPKTGYPANNGLISVSIVSESGMLADGLSTACFVMGVEDAVKFWRSSEENFDMILMTDDDEVYITEGLDGRFSSEYPLHVISRIQADDHE